MGHNTDTKEGINELLYLISRVSDSGVLNGRKKLIKLGFFAEHFDIPGDKLVSSKSLGVFDFIIYKYGPFSHEMMDAFDELKEMGYVSEEKRPWEHRICLTKNGKEHIDNVQHALKRDKKTQIDAIAEEFSGESGGSLEKKSLEYLGITKDDKPQYMGNPVSVLIDEGALA